MVQHSNFEKILELIAQAKALSQAHRYELDHGRLDQEALDVLNQAETIDNHFPPLWLERAVVLTRLGQYQKAMDDFDRFLKQVPEADDVRELRHSATELAFEQYEQHIALNPDDVNVIAQRGDLYARLYRLNEALSDYQAALALQPDHFNALQGCGDTLTELNRHDEALKYFNQLSTLAPTSSLTYFNRGHVLQQMNRIDEALLDFQQAQHYQTDFAQAIMEQALCYLVKGDYQAAWPLYEIRWSTPQMKTDRLQTGAPQWTGKESLRDQTILLWAEQGFGDAIQFVRYIPLVAKDARQVIIHVPHALLNLFEDFLQHTKLNSTTQLISDAQALPLHDLHCPLMSLALAFQTGLSTIPNQVPYLYSDTSKVAIWRERLHSLQRPRIGLVWSGRPEAMNRTRDIPLELLRPLLDLHTSKGLEFVSLQKTLHPDDYTTVESLPQLRLVNDLLHDFADTAALIENLDLIISVDTAVVHLAGALGKPVWLMLRYSGEWRWLLNQTDSPWYPTFRIFRQRQHGDWSNVIDDVCNALR